MSGICRTGFLVILLLGLVAMPVLATDVVTVARYASGESEAEFVDTYTITWMEENLPVLGDGTTHYYLQGPIFDESADPWNPAEDTNCYPIKDMGAVRGTDVADLCELAGGAHQGDVILIRADDGFRKSFPYENVYTPPARQGRMVVAWEKDGQKAGAGYGDGMRLQFFADTSVNPWGEHIFGTSDMRAALPEEYWHFYQPGMPASTGLSVQSVSRIEIYESSGGQPPVVPSGDSDGGADVWAPATGTLTVLSVPADAAVVIDGAVSEYRTNVSIPEMPEGSYGVTVKCEGYETPDEEWLWVSDGSNSTVTFSLTGISAPCTFVTHPENARIAVDGVDTGILANTEPLSLIIGNHTVTFTMEGYVPLEIPVTITAGESNRVEGVLVSLCGDDDVPLLSAGPHGSLNGGLSVMTAAGYPGFIAGGESVQVPMPDGAGEEITSYLFFSHGYDTASGLPAEPQPSLSSGGERVIPRLLANAITPVGTVDQTCALFMSPSSDISLSSSGGPEDVFGLSAAVSLFAQGGPEPFSYAVYEGCVPAQGLVCTLPADALPDGGISTLTMLCTDSGGSTNAPVISVNGMTPDAVYTTLMPGLVEITMPLPPGTGAYTVTADGASPGCMVRVVVVTADTPSSVSDTDVSGESDGLPGKTEDLPGKTDVLSGETDEGFFAGIYRFFASLFSPDAKLPSAPSAPSTPSPPSVARPVPGADSQQGVNPVSPASEPGMTPDAVPASPQSAPGEGIGSPALTGGVLVESVPSGAWILLDGKSTGKKTPALFAGLKEGTHRIGVSSALTTDSRSEKVWVYPGALVPVFVDFSSVLPEATIQVESGTGEPVAFTVNGILPDVTTPAQVTIRDTRSFAAVTSDEGSLTCPITYRRDGGTLTLTPPACGACTAAVTSDPAGAEVIVDGRRTGERTPAEISCLSPGPHRVVCSLPGYYPDAQVVSVSDHSGEPDAEVAFTLASYSNGGLSVTSVPAGAQVYLYDRYTGLVTPATISGLPIGTYEIGLSTDDETLVREVTVLPNTVAAYEFRFSEVSEE